MLNLQFEIFGCKMFELDLKIKSITDKLYPSFNTRKLFWKK